MQEDKKNIAQPPNGSFVHGMVLPGTFQNFQRTAQKRLGGKGNMNDESRDGGVFLATNLDPDPNPNLPHSSYFRGDYLNVLERHLKA